ncbi:MAG: ACP S-malonyltransferase, partial [Nannocystaceae bacterium]
MDSRARRCGGRAWRRGGCSGSGSALVGLTGEGCMMRAFLFPGQSSRYSGLLSKLMALSPENRALASRASELVNFDVVDHYDQGAEQAFARNVDVQVGVFLANHMWLRTMEAHGVRAQLSAGLSLGEWNHLVHIGAVSFEDALLAVRARGEAYDAGPRGFMASIQPVDLDELQEVVTAVAEMNVGLVEIVNLNSPRQHVVAGDQPAVEEVMRRVEDDLFGQPVVIERQVPMHASSFAP